MRRRATRSESARRESQSQRKRSTLEATNDGTSETHASEQNVSAASSTKQRTHTTATAHSSGAAGSSCSVAFFHPDLGLGGAERLIVDAAVGLQNLGHDVTIYTSRHDVNRCFTETRDGTLRIVVHGQFLPRHVFGALHIWCATFKAIWLALCVIFLHGAPFDVAIVDQISAAIPLLRWFAYLFAPHRRSARIGRQIAFYGHYPDFLLTQRQSLVKRVYRYPMDCLEAWTTEAADMIMVNSKFTAEAFRRTMPALARRELLVLYPSVNMNNYEARGGSGDVGRPPHRLAYASAASALFVSLNRFERKKNLKLALDAFSLLKAAAQPRIRAGSSRRKSNATEKHANSKRKLHLVMAGGYDEAVLENVEHCKELIEHAQSLDLCVAINGIPLTEDNDNVDVSFVQSFTDKERNYLLANATALLYTPVDEHFGIVPVEAMCSECVVLATNTGGPRESIAHNQTGFLLQDNAKIWAQTMRTLVNDPQLVRKIGAAGRERVRQRFSLQHFADQLHAYISHQ